MMNETLGRRIAALRRRKDLTQEALAEKLGVSPQAVSKWENDLSCPDIQLLPALAQLLGVTVDVLLSGESAQETSLTPPGERKPLEQMVMHIVICGDDGGQVRVNLPMALVEVGVQMGDSTATMLNINGTPALQQVNLAAMLELVRRGTLGKLLELDDSEGNHVEIWVE